MNPIITTLIIIGIVLLIIAAIVLFVKWKLNSVTRKYLNMNLKQTADLIGKGLKEEVTTPKPISNVSAVYKPRLMRDFPDMSYERFLDMANTALTSILVAIQTGNTDSIKDATDTVKQKVINIVAGNNSRNTVEHYDDIKIHRTAISDYRSTSDTATAVFEISFQCFHWLEGEKKSSRPENPTQYAASVTLSYGKEFAENATNLTYSHNCPNCGAPVYAVGGKIVCKFCGTGITEDIYKSWLVSAYNFIK